MHLGLPPQRPTSGLAPPGSTSRHCTHLYHNLTALYHLKLEFPLNGFCPFKNFPEAASGPTKLPALAAKSSPKVPITVSLKRPITESHGF